MQLADELPMIYTTCVMGYTTFAYGKSRLQSFGVAAIFGALAWAITVSIYLVFLAPLALF
jgi:dihydroceramidase